MNLDQYEKLVFSRHAVREFRPDVIPVELIERLVAIAQQAPSAYNLQPTHLYIVRQQHLKEALFSASLGQKQVLTAPVVVVFAGDRDVVEHNYEKVSEADLASGAMVDGKKEVYRMLVDMSFSKKPLGFGWLSKALLAPCIRWCTPLPELPAIHKRAWLYKQASLVAMNFMLAAQSAGLATCPMECFDQNRVKKALKIPRRYVVPLIMPLGFPAERPTAKSRLPLSDTVHWM